ncbi:MAG TPA: formylmethanofuran dehydrogenase [Ramlibacter sp.]|uniref:formylmethanofuran dehydrogenase n=1 Tax=Ramlibacter sp. TaxID=1917967 RepID=UPI002ED1B541
MEANWTCPFCALLCDSFALEGGPEALALNGSTCPRARAGLAAHARPEAPVAFIDGVAVEPAQAIAEAARRLARWRQPLFGGLGIDMAGARALFKLAARTGAICDHADGEPLAQGLRALQDRGQFHTTLAEIGARADVVVCVGTQATARYPEFFRRCGLDRADGPCTRLVFLGAEPPEDVPGALAPVRIAGSGDLFADLQQLAALLGPAPCHESDPELAGLARMLGEARYAVLVWEPAMLRRHGALAAEMLLRIVMALNRGTRAASFALGGSDGAATVQQVFTWLSGLPLRTRFGRAGFEHEPVRFAGEALLADRAVDGLLWTWSFAPGRLPPATDLSRVVLGPPAMGSRLREGRVANQCVFVPVATPGVNAAGHLFRGDGVVVPLVAVRDDGVPALDRVVAELLVGLEEPE